MLVVVARLPGSDRALVEAARCTGLALADVRTRLAGPFPRLLLVEADEEQARSKATTLEDLGFVIITCDPRSVPRDDERYSARTLELGQSGFVAVGDQGDREEVPASALLLIQRGARVTTTTEVTKKSERRLDLTRAVLTGGLLLTKKVETKATRTTTSQESFLLLHRKDGGRDIVIYGRRIDYRFLGVDLQPASAANFERMTAKLRALAPRVPYDDRVSRPGLVSGLSSAAANPIDLAVWLVLLTHLRGVAAS